MVKKEKIKTKSLNFWAIIFLIIIVFWVFFDIFNKNNNSSTSQNNTQINNIPISVNYTNNQDIKNDSITIEENIKEDTQNKYDKFSNVEELHWTHMPLVYKINFSEYPEDVRNRKKLRVKYATERIHNVVSYIEFKETKGDDYDILILGEIPTNKRLNWSERNSSEGDINIGAIALPKYSGNFMINATIYYPELLNDDGGYIGGSGTDTEVHELMHILGIGHSNVIGGMMSPIASSLNKEIEETIISCLKKIYSNGQFKGNCSKVNLYKDCGRNSYLGKDNKCHESCPTGYVLGEGYKCYEECGNGYYCPEDSYCYNEKCYSNS